MGQYVEDQAWLPNPAGMAHKQYRAYAPDMLGGWSPQLGDEALDAVTSAHAALVRIGVLETTALGGTVAAWMIARDESLRSSLIEGVHGSRDGLAWAQYMERVQQPVSDQNEALTLGAVKQIRAAVDLGGRIRDGNPCTVDDLRELHNVLFENTRDRSIGGLIRKEPIWIGPAHSRIEDATFVAPPPTMLPPLVDDLVAYINSAHHPVALQAAIMHAQFETIHPFEDGNGRTGRALIHTVLVARGLLTGPLPISAALEHNRSDYYAALSEIRVVCEPDDSAVRTRGFQRWLSVFRDACIEAERQTMLASSAAEGLAAKWQAHARFRSDSTAAKLLRALPSMPVFDVSMVVEQLGVTPKSARSAIRALIQVQIVQPTGGNRNTRYTVPELTERLRGSGPEGGPVSAAAHAAMIRHIVKVKPQRPVTSGISCNFRGPRSNKSCLLPKGHLGQHRYQLS